MHTSNEDRRDNNFTNHSKDVNTASKDFLSVKRDRYK